MSLSGSLQIGRSGLLASQAAIEVAGNNLANMATPGYRRQQITLAPMPSQQVQQGVFVGRGVQITQITRVVNEALEARLRSSLGDEAGAAVRQDLLAQIEAIQNEFSGQDLSTHLGTFFNAWSQLAMNPQDQSLRSLVVQEGSSLGTYLQTLRSDLASVRTAVDKSIDNAVIGANNILKQLETVNQAILTGERGQGGAHGLRDQRDMLLAELSQYLDVSTVEHSSGLVDIFVASTPIMLNGRSQGLEVRKLSVNDELQIDVVLKTDGTVLNTTSGSLGALVAARREDVTTAVAFLDEFTNQLIFEVNRIHSQGQGLRHFDELTTTNRVFDASMPLNSAEAALPFAAAHGSFRVHVTQLSTGQRTSHTIHVDLDGINPASDTSLNSLAADLNAIAGMKVTVTADGRLRIASDVSDLQFSFSDDTSGVLAALGINSFFTGSNAQDIAVHASLKQTPSLLAVGQEHLAGDNRNALAIAGLRDRQLGSLGGLSLTQYWSRHVEDYAIRSAQAQQRHESSTLVRESLQAQQQQISGVNADEEAINLLQYQRAYQSSARFISIIDELMQTLLGLI